jgi:hypothetical protein
MTTIVLAKQEGIFGLTHGRGLYDWLSSRNKGYPATVAAGLAVSAWYERNKSRNSSGSSGASIGASGGSSNLGQHTKHALTHASAARTAASRPAAKRARAAKRAQTGGAPAGSQQQKTRTTTKPSHKQAAKRKDAGGGSTGGGGKRRTNPGSKAKPVEGRRFGSTDENDWTQYASQTEAARKCGVNVGSVSQCVQHNAAVDVNGGNYREAGGYEFRYSKMS